MIDIDKSETGGMKKCYFIYIQSSKHYKILKFLRINYKILKETLKIN